MARRRAIPYDLDAIPPRTDPGAHAAHRQNGRSSRELVPHPGHRVDTNSPPPIASRELQTAAVAGRQPKRPDQLSCGRPTQPEREPVRKSRLEFRAFEPERALEQLGAERRLPNPEQTRCDPAKPT